MQAPIFRTSWTSFLLVALNRAREWRDLAPFGPLSKRKTPLPSGAGVVCMGLLLVTVAWKESVPYVSSPQGGGAGGVGTTGVLGTGGGSSVPVMSAMGRLFVSSTAATTAALAVAVAASAAAAASSPRISGSRYAGCRRAAAAAAMVMFAESECTSSARRISWRRSSAVGARSTSSAGGCASGWSARRIPLILFPLRPTHLFPAGPCHCPGSMAGSQW